MKKNDRVQQHKLIEILHQLHINGKDTSIIKNMYYRQKTKIKIDGQLSNEVETRRGVHQRYISI